MMLTDYGIAVDEKKLISCVTVTKGRSDLIGSAINCFLSQTYSPCEMIIVSQGTADQNREIEILTNGHENIHFVVAPRHLTLGGMRNLSVELAHGEIICQWDDDDWYHPERLSSQFRFMRGDDSVACLYTKYLKYFFDTNKMYVIDHLGGTDDYLDLCKTHNYKKYLAGSVMFNKNVFHLHKNKLYPNGGEQSDKEEDLFVLKKLESVGRVSPVNCGYQYCYNYHGNNVYQRKTHVMQFHKKGTATEKELLSYRPEIEKLLGAAKFKKTVEVCSTAILDFDQLGTVLEGKVEYLCSGSS